MATVPEDYTTEEQNPVMRFLCAKGLFAKDSHKETFPVYGGKCFLNKAVHNSIEKRGQRFADDEC
jgi:hypothetical protein